MVKIVKIRVHIYPSYSPDGLAVVEKYQKKKQNNTTTATTTTTNPSLFRGWFIPNSPKETKKTKRYPSPPKKRTWDANDPFKLTKHRCRFFPGTIIQRTIIRPVGIVTGTILELFQKELGIFFGHLFLTATCGLKFKGWIVSLPNQTCLL